MSHLTEKTLLNVLNNLSNDWIFNKTIPNSPTKSRPDYRSDKLGVIVEFDGYHHYASASRIIADTTNESIYVKLGYDVIRIPYFVQLDAKTCLHLFGVEFNDSNIYPQGFVSPKALLPCDFCELGVQRFRSDLSKFLYIKDEIMQSIETLIKVKGNSMLVIPPSLNDLLSMSIK